MTVLSVCIVCAAPVNSAAAGTVTVTLFRVALLAAELGLPWDMVPTPTCRYRERDAGLMATV